jgi:hypothetical protein
MARRELHAMFSAASHDAPVESMARFDRSGGRLWHYFLI